MQRHKVLDFLLHLGAICLFVDIGVESREGFDTRDIAVSDKIVAAKEVKRLFSLSTSSSLSIHAHVKVRVLDKSWLHVGLIMSNYELTTRWESNHLQNQDNSTRFPHNRKEHNITVELQVVGILDREGGQVVCLSQI